MKDSLDNLDSIDEELSAQDWDWLDIQHPERGRALDEILKRGDFAHRKYGRVSSFIRTRETAAERFRSTVHKKYKTWLLKNHQNNFSGQDTRHIEERERRKAVRELIKKLSPNLTPPKRSFLFRSLNQTHILRPITAIRNCLKVESRQQETELTAFRHKVRDMFKKLRSLYDEGQPMHPAGLKEADFLDEGRTIVPPLMPYPPGDAAYKAWINLWRLPDEPETPVARPKRETRMFWEGFYDRQHFSIWEDFEDLGSAEASELVRRVDGKLAIFPKRTALDTAYTWIKAWSQTKHIRDFKWLGNLLSVNHIWTLPIEAILNDLSNDELNQAILELSNGEFYSPTAQKILQSSEALALRSFQQRDQTRLNEQRNDLVFSVLGAGEAILVCDFRPYSRDDTHKERATRMLVICLNADQDKLGRIIRRLLDVDARRIIALRDFQYIFPIRDVITDLSAALSREESEHQYDMAESRISNISKRLTVWLDMSTRLAALNHFLNEGVTGFHSAAVENRQHIRNNLADLRESALPGYQSLTSYMRRFEAAVTTTEIVQAKYQALRARLDEMINISRAELQRLETMRTASRARVALIFSLLILSIAGLNIWHVGRDSKYNALLELGTVGVISAVIASSVGLVLLKISNKIVRSAISWLRSQLGIL